VVTFDLRPGAEAEFLALLTPLLDAMRHEPTFVNAVLHRDPEDTSRLMLYETWADRDDLVQAQMKRAYRRAYEARLPALLRAPRGVQVWHKLRADFAFFAA
jgi:quinol monooxygenase YgiN